jgi:hypothetical protein
VKQTLTGKTEGFAVMTVASASLDLIIDAGFAGFWIQKALRIHTDPARAAAPIKKKPGSRLSQKSKPQSLMIPELPRIQPGKIESSAAMKAASAPLVRMAGVVSAARRDKNPIFSATGFRSRFVLRNPDTAR